MAKKLTSFVHLRDPGTGETRVFGPEDTVPSDWAKLITNPKVFGEVPDEPTGPVPATSQTPAPEPPATKKSTAKRSSTRKASARGSRAKRSTRGGASS